MAISTKRIKVKPIIEAKLDLYDISKKWLKYCRWWGIFALKKNEHGDIVSVNLKFRCFIIILSQIAVAALSIIFYYDTDYGINPFCSLKTLLVITCHTIAATIQGGKTAKNYFIIYKEIDSLLNLNRKYEKEKKRLDKIIFQIYGTFIFIMIEFVVIYLFVLNIDYDKTCYTILFILSYMLPVLTIKVQFITSLDIFNHRMETYTKLFEKYFCPWDKMKVHREMFASKKGITENEKNEKKEKAEAEKDKIGDDGDDGDALKEPMLDFYPMVTPQSHEKLATLTRCFLLINRQYDILNYYNGIPILLNYVSTTVASITLANQVVTAIKSGNDLVPAFNTCLDTLFHLGLFVWSVNLSCYAERSRQRVFLALDKVLAYTELSPWLREQMRELRGALRERRLVLSAHGFMAVDRGMLRELAALLVSYTVILVQMNRARRM